MPSVVQERRKFARHGAPSRVEVNLLRPQGLIPANTVNLSEGGVCCRLEEMLEVRSLVRLQVMKAPPARSLHPVECTGRVAWVIQRLDLRPTPPFLFDIGIEFVDPPPLLRFPPLKGRVLHQRALESSLIRGRQFVPRLERDVNHGGRWHLVVSVEGTPCFSGHYPSERAALAAWGQFRRQQARR